MGAEAGAVPAAVNTNLQATAVDFLELLTELQRLSVLSATRTVPDWLILRLCRCIRDLASAVHCRVSAASNPLLSASSGSPQEPFFIDINELVAAVFSCFRNLLAADLREDALDLLSTDVLFLVSTTPAKVQQFASQELMQWTVVYPIFDTGLLRLCQQLTASELEIFFHSLPPRIYQALTCSRRAFTVTETDAAQLIDTNPLFKSLLSSPLPVFKQLLCCLPEEVQMTLLSTPSILAEQLYHVFQLPVDELPAARIQLLWAGAEDLDRRYQSTTFRQSFSNAAIEALQNSLQGINFQRAFIFSESFFENLSTKTLTVFREVPHKESCHL